MNRWKTGEGINLDVLQFVLEHNPIKAVLVISNFSNPTGTVLSYERHLRRIRQGLKETVEATRRAILDCFPPGHDRHEPRRRIPPLGHSPAGP